MIELLESQFGTIKIYYNRTSRRISLKFNTDGSLKITAPVRTSKRLIARFLDQSAVEINAMIQKFRQQKQYLPGMAISKTCLLKLEYDATLNEPVVKIRPNFLVVCLPFGAKVQDEAVQSLIRPQIQKILRREAKEILLPRVHFLAEKNGFTLDKVKLRHDGSRWGSCRATTKTINLNIALVTLENDLIDYVIIHELCHLRQMNHGLEFWSEVAAILPNYKSLDKKLKQFRPHL